jgi:hypothetical protein
MVRRGYSVDNNQSNPANNGLLLEESVASKALVWRRHTTNPIMVNLIWQTMASGEEGAFSCERRQTK